MICTFEDLVGRLIADEAFRKTFYADPLGTVAAEAIPVSAAEVGALLCLPAPFLSEFARALPPGPLDGGPAWRSVQLLRRH